MGGPATPAHVVTTSLVLALVFLVAGVVVFLVSDKGVGQGLIGTATGLAIGSAVPPTVNAIARNGTRPDG